MPYAAKAVIQHEYIAGTLNLWLTFWLPMNQKVKPLDTVWIVEIDAVPTAVTSSVWVDAHTMKLIITGLGSKPARVTVQFDGPDPNLCTTWGKDWEPWGPILSTDLTATLFFSGAILLWYGSVASIPSGWHLCDGMNGTPDLRDRFIVGARQDVGGNAKTYVDSTWTKTGGDVVHSHSGDTGMVNYGFAFDALSGIDDAFHLPPYYALAYIMKL
jgi:hypothetical protein